MRLRKYISTLLKKLNKNDEGLSDAVGIVMSLVTIVVIGAIGVFIADRTITATNLNPNMLNASDTANMTSNANITAMQSAILGAGQTGSQFIVILIIAFIGGVAISYLLGMWGRKST